VLSTPPNTPVDYDATTVPRCCRLRKRRCRSLAAGVECLPSWFQLISSIRVMKINRYRRGDVDPSPASKRIGKWYRSSRICGLAPNLRSPDALHSARRTMIFIQNIRQRDCRQSKPECDRPADDCATRSTRGLARNADRRSRSAPSQFLADFSKASDYVAARLKSVNGFADEMIKCLVLQRRTSKLTSSRAWPVTMPERPADCSGTERGDRY
jgi:hypothetical protein